MSEARNQRFEIDIDEIERQLRRSVEEPQAQRPDPLAELARIVGQNDPFRGILTPDAGRTEPSFGDGQHDVHALQRQAALAAQDSRQEPHFGEFEQAVLHGHPAEGRHDPAHDDLFDPVSEAYGSQNGAMAQEEFQPLQPRRSRGRLAAVMAGLLVTVSAVAGGLYLNKSGGSLLSSSNGPPVITADKTPLKVAPENPGGMDVPNQNRQIYERTPDGQSRVVDGREQPIDVRAAARSMPAPNAAPPASGPVISARNPVSSEGTDQSAAVTSALGDPRRVRTVAVNPDGTGYGPSSTSALGQSPMPTQNLPSPKPVKTVDVPTRTAALGAPAMSAPETAAPPAAAATSNALPEPAAEAPSRPAVSVLPPARPKLDAKPTPAAEAPARVAALPPPTAKPVAAPKPTTDKPAAEKPEADKAKSFSVQIAVRPSEAEARKAWDEAQDKFGDKLQGKPARMTKAEVGGKTVHRVRLGPMTKAEADSMCGRLKSNGGSCFVAPN